LLALKGDEMENYEFAKRLAEMMHHGQEYGAYPYTYHLQQVEMVINRFGFKDDMVLRICAWLHDLIEDTEISYNQVHKSFGQVIADIVYAVTNEMGRNRKERFSKTYPKIVGNERALVLKLADRIANIEFAKGTDTNFVKMYKKEWKAFKSALHDDLIIDIRIRKMWTYLENIFDDGDEDVRQD
jgi:(p)ppGpp synthase/HD superfamily hydrolase